MAYKHLQLLFFVISWYSQSVLILYICLTKNERRLIYCKNSYSARDFPKNNNRILDTRRSRRDCTNNEIQKIAQKLVYPFVKNSARN